MLFKVLRCCSFFFLLSIVFDMEMYTDNIEVCERALELMLRRLHHAQLKRIFVLSMYTKSIVSGPSLLFGALSS